MTHFVRPQIRKNLRTFAGLSTLVLVFGAATALAAPASGQAKPDEARPAHHHGPGDGTRLFERWDKDNDGRITIAELPARMKEHISTLDTNKDGVLTREEFDKGREQLRARREKQFDKNGDGKVTEEERREVMRAHVVERFVEQDKNHDGYLVESEIGTPQWAHMKAADSNSDSKISLDELKVAFDEGKLRPPPRGGKGPHAKLTEAEMKGHAQQRFTADDKNKDGFLTESEIPGRWAHLVAADANQDKRLTSDELTAAFKSGKIKGRGPHHGHGHGPGQHGQAK